MATVTANLPVNLALSGVTGPRLLQQQMAVDVNADSLPLELIPAFTGVVSDVHGKASAQVVVRGTFNAPRVAGGLLLNRGTLRLTSTGMYLDEMKQQKTPFVEIKGEIVARQKAAIEAIQKQFNI